MTTRRFRGSKDPNTIVLADLFPLTNIKISTELEVVDTSSRVSYREFVFEGEEEHLRFIETNSGLLEEKGWRFGDPLMEGESELRIFQPKTESFREHIEVPVLRGWRELSDHFVLANRVKLVVKRHSRLIIEMVCDLESDTTDQANLLRIATPKSVPYKQQKRLN